MALLGTGSGSFGPKTDVSVGAVPHGLALADLNGDGHLDFVVANTGADTVTVLLGNGTGSFTTSAFATGAAPVTSPSGISNGDGMLDLAVVNVNADTVSVLLGGEMAVSARKRTSPRVEKHDSPWVTARQDQLQSALKKAW